MLRTLRGPRDLDLIKSHIAEVHGASTLEDVWPLYESYPGLTPEQIFIWEEDGVAASHLFVRPRLVRLGTAVVPTGEISVVGTLPAYRNRGYAAALIRAALEFQRRQGLPLSLIYGIPNFYERFGYAYAIGSYLSRFESYVDVTLAVKAAPATTCRVRQFSPADWPSIHALYSDENAARSGTTQREDPIWRWLHGSLQRRGILPPDGFLVVEDGGAVTGYAWLNERPVNWFLGDDASRFGILESAARNSAAVEAIVAAAARRASDLGVERIGLYLPADNPVQRRLFELGSVLRARTASGFLRIVDAEAVLRLCQQCLVDRVRHSELTGWRGTLRVRADDQVVTVDLGDRSPVVDLSLSCQSLIQALSGYHTVAELPDARLSPKHASLLAVLLPRGNPVMNLAETI